MASLVLLDSYPVEEERRVETKEEQIMTDMVQAYARLHGDDAPQALDRAGTRERIVAYMGRGESESRYLSDEQRGAVLDVLVGNVRLVSPVEPAPFKGRVLLVAATENVREWARPQDWQPYLAGAFERYELATTHEAMLTPGPAAEIGRILSRQL